jgi:hypothetical protein
LCHRLGPIGSQAKGPPWPDPSHGEQLGDEVVHGGQPSSDRVVAVEPKLVKGQSAQRGQHHCTESAIAVGILMELGVAELVTPVNAPSVPHQFQQGFWRSAQAGEEEVPLEGN